MKARAAAVVVVTLLSAAACSSGPAINTGPFGNGGMHATQCTPVPPGGVLTFGFQAIRNSGKSPGVIERVSLYRPQHLSQLAAYVVPVTGSTLYGARPGFPIAHPYPAFQWAQRHRADGARIPPWHPGLESNLLVIVKPGAQTATAKAIDVFYREAGAEYHLRLNTVIRTVWAKSC